MMWMRNLAAIILLAVLTSCSAVQEQPEALTYYCGTQALTVQPSAKAVTLFMRGEQQQLSPSVTASGARFKSVDERTEYWSKGHEATVVWKDETLPLCVEQGHLPEDIALKGNEPFWLLTINKQRASFTTPTEEQEFAVINTTGKSSSNRWQLDFMEAGTLVVTQALCHDSMSGKAHPYRVSGTLNGTDLQGCGGETERLLQGQPWSVDQLAGFSERMLAQAELQFLPKGRLVGNDGCNRFVGQYSVQGEIPRLHVVGSTKRMCTQEIMRFAQKFTALLNNTTKVVIKDTNIVLKANDGQQLSFTPTY